MSEKQITIGESTLLHRTMKMCYDDKRVVNGKTAERLYIKYIESVTGIKAVALPSTSPANAAWSLVRLTEVWAKEIRNRE